MRMGKGRDELRSAALFPCQAQSSVSINPDMVICPHLSSLLAEQAFNPDSLTLKPSVFPAVNLGEVSHNKGQELPPRESRENRLRFLNGVFCLAHQRALLVGGSVRMSFTSSVVKMWKGDQVEGARFCRLQADLPAVLT